MVILVNENDLPIGRMHKLEAHEKGCLHRAFSVFIFNTQGECLLQKRAIHKYHSGGLWTNTCCSHPSPGQATLDAAHCRLQMEMGIDAPLKYVRKFMYRSPFENGLTEHEIDHIYIGYTDDQPTINPEEVSEYKYMPLNEILEDMKRHPQNYTTWFRIISANFLSELSVYSKKDRL